MPRPRYHVFVCVQARPPGHPRGACQAKGGMALAQAFLAELQKRAAYDTVTVTQAGCLGPCDTGANVLVYPEGVLYGRVDVHDVAEIFDQHFGAGTPVARLRVPESAW